MRKGAWLSRTSKQQFLTLDAPTRSADLALIADLVARGELSPTIDQLFTFAELPQAFARLGSRRARGKIVVQLP